MEKWSQLIPGTDNFLINKDGLIVCHPQSEGSVEILANQNGEKIVALKQDKKESETLMISLALLVAMHFVPNPFRFSELEYIDGDVSNCSADNLRWTGDNPLKLQNMAYKITADVNIKNDIAKNRLNTGPEAVLENIPEDESEETEKENKTRERKFSANFYFGNPNLPLQIVEGTVMLPFDAVKRRLENTMR